MSKSHSLHGSSTGAIRCLRLHGGFPRGLEMLFYIKRMNYGHHSLPWSTHARKTLESDNFIAFDMLRSFVCHKCDGNPRNNQVACFSSRQGERCPLRTYISLGRPLALDQRGQHVSIR